MVSSRARLNMSKVRGRDYGDCKPTFYHLLNSQQSDCDFLDKTLTCIQVSPESDPRPYRDEPPPHTPSDFPSLHDHDPWASAGDISDPEEADIEEHITHGPGGSVMFSRTIRSSNFRGPSRSRRDPLPEDDPDHVLRDFQNMVGNMVGPGFRAGQPGRSGTRYLVLPRAIWRWFRVRWQWKWTTDYWWTGHFYGYWWAPPAKGRRRPQPAGPQVDDLTTYASPPQNFP